MGCRASYSLKNSSLEALESPLVELYGHVRKGLEHSPPDGRRKRVGTQLDRELRHSTRTAERPEHRPAPLSFTSDAIISLSPQESLGCHPKGLAKSVAEMREVGETEIQRRLRNTANLTAPNCVAAREQSRLPNFRDRRFLMASESARHSARGDMVSLSNAFERQVHLG